MNDKLDPRVKERRRDLLIKAARRKNIQYAILMDNPGSLRGDDYEIAFRSGLIDGEWSYSQTGMTSRKYRNGAIPNTVWTPLRDLIIEARRQKNMYCNPAPNDYNVPHGESLTDIRHVGHVAATQLPSDIEYGQYKTNPDLAWLERHNEWRRSLGFGEIVLKTTLSNAQGR